MPQVNLNLDQLDDTILSDGTPSFEGGQVSNSRPNILKPNQSFILVNCDIDTQGKLRTRRGSGQFTGGVVNIADEVTGLIHFKTKVYDLVVAANNGRVAQYTGAGWTQIKSGGVGGDVGLSIYRFGSVNNAAGYNIGDTTFILDTMTGF